VNTALYLDYYARTPIHPAAQAVMASLPAESYGNPSCGHGAGADGA